MRRLLLSLAALLGLAAPLMAQLDLSAPMLRGTWSAYGANPAMLPENKFTLALPSAMVHTQYQGFTYADWVGTNDQGQTVLTVENGLAQLAANNQLRNRADIGTVGAGVWLGNWFLSLGHSIRSQSLLAFPRELAQLAWQGNAAFIGQTIEVAPNFVGQGYQELALGLAFSPSPAFSVGGRFKLLNGFGDVSSARNLLQLTTSDDIYQLELLADYAFNATGTLDYNGFERFVADINFGRFTNSASWTGNYGFGLDFGFSSQLGPLYLGASLLDVGSIRWEDEVSNLNIQGRFAFQGLDIFPRVLEDSINFNEIVDTLEAILEIKETRSPYITALPLHAFFTAQLDLGDYWRLGGVLYFDRYRKFNAAALGLSLQAQIGSVLSLGGMYIIRNGSFSNLGCNAVLQLGPVQVVASTDNLPGLIDLDNSRLANVRLGFNLTFGEVDGASSGSKKPGYLRRQRFFRR